LLEAAGGRVDVLVNNAGYGELGPVETVPEAEARRQMETNFFAPAALIRAVLPSMRAARSGTIVNVSSIAGRFGYPLAGWYCASKHALEALSDSLRLEMRPFGVSVVLVEPGPVRTEFFDIARDRARPQLDDEGSPYRAFFRHTDDTERRFLRQACGPEDVARVIVKALLARRPRDRYAVTVMAKASLLARALLPRRLFDAALRRQFRVPRPDELGAPG
ncbi:MAG: SDR family NAD(P)-dependent oxidoreductase, partial [Planctomycetota bacterium]